VHEKPSEYGERSQQVRQDGAGVVRGRVARPPQLTNVGERGTEIKTEFAKPLAVQKPMSRRGAHSRPVGPPPRLGYAISVWNGLPAGQPMERATLVRAELVADEPEHPAQPVEEEKERAPEY
jgi:hypothetical protein